jgi:hypothetical protein
MMFLIFGSKNGVEMLLRFFVKSNGVADAWLPALEKGGRSAWRLALDVGRGRGVFGPR